MRITKPGDTRVGFEGQWAWGEGGREWEMDKSDKAPAQSHDQRDGGAFHMPCPSCKETVWRHIPDATGYLSR